MVRGLMLNLVRGLLVVGTAPVEPLAVVQLNQLSLEGQAADAISSYGVNTLADVDKQRDAKIFVVAMSAERNGGHTRLLAVTEVVGDGEKHPPIIGDAVV
jgi:hypothetical protein